MLPQERVWASSLSSRVGFCIQGCWLRLSHSRRVWSRSGHGDWDWLLGCRNMSLLLDWSQNLSMLRCRFRESCRHSCSLSTSVCRSWTCTSRSEVVRWGVSWEKVNIHVRVKVRLDGVYVRVGCHYASKHLFTLQLNNIGSYKLDSVCIWFSHAAKTENSTQNVMLRKRERPPNNPSTVSTIITVKTT